MKPVKLHKHLFVAVIENCDRIFNECRYADKVIESNLKQHKQWGSRDRAFVASHTYDMVRWKRLLQYLTDTGERTDLGALWMLLAALRWKQQQPIPEWKEWAGFHPGFCQKRWESAQHIRSIRTSIPDWLDATGQQALPERWEQEAEALNEPAPVYIRANTLRTSAKQLQQLLHHQDIETETVPGVPAALKLLKRVNVFSSPLFRDGYFEVQDIASQMVASFMELKPGMRVVDACAGAGGKSLHIAALLENKGKIISMDTEAWKLDELKRRARRAGIDTIETRLLDSAKVIKRLEHSADRLLLDVPCSGLGVLRRNPDAKWKLQPDFIDRIRVTQQEILDQYMVMLKPGGKLIYATCSILPEEDEQQIQTFLTNHPEFILEAEHRTWPSEGMDGFYMARLCFR